METELLELTDLPYLCRLSLCSWLKYFWIAFFLNEYQSRIASRRFSTSADQKPPVHGKSSFEESMKKTTVPCHRVVFFFVIDFVAAE
jgi:hypothetical protein